MPNMTVRNIPEDDYALLRQEARQRRSSINSEILEAIRYKTEELKRRKRAARAMVRIDKLRDEIARKFPNQTDSVTLIREDRDSR
ncbi:MAG: FitA-like ribbon-helix-helix domain-containing protein [Terriglobia bacterium]